MLIRPAAARRPRARAARDEPARSARPTACRASTRSRRRARRATCWSPSTTGASSARPARSRFGPTAWIGGVTVAPGGPRRPARPGPHRGRARRARPARRPSSCSPRRPAGRSTSASASPPSSLYRVLRRASSQSDSRGQTPSTQRSREAALALDRHATGEDRRLAVEAGLDGALMTPDGARRRAQPALAARPILARDPDAGARAAARRDAAGHPLRRAGGQRGRGRRLLEELGCPDRPRGVLRMRLGKPVDWRPDEVWGVFSLLLRLGRGQRSGLDAVAGRAPPESSHSTSDDASPSPSAGSRRTDSSRSPPKRTIATA